MGPKFQRYGTWMYPPIGSDLATVGMDEIGVYISLRQKTVAQYIATRPIMDLCLAAERKPGLQLSRKWWEQPAIYILGMIVGLAAAKGVGGYRDGVIGGRGRVRGIVR